MKKLLIFLAIGLSPNLMAKLPKNIKWISNDNEPLIASPKAVKGGKIRYSIPSYPLTFRTVGPNSNTGIRNQILANNLSLLALNPITRKYMPSLAEKWAYKGDGKTMYFKLNPKATWSDGNPVKASDFAYVLTFMRSKHIQAPWYNNYYTKEIKTVVAHGKNIVEIVSAKVRPPGELEQYSNLSPYPEHFWKKYLNKNFVKKANWKAAPNTGPYTLDRFKRGKKITFKRNKKWWARNLRFYKNRFNVDKVEFKVVKNQSVVFERFLKGDFDSASLTFPSRWHGKKDLPQFKKGYIHRLWFYTNQPQGDQGFFMNHQDPLFKDLYMREAFSYAINFKKMNRVVLKGDYKRLEHTITGYGPYSNKMVKSRTFNIKKVEKIMKKHGWKRNKQLIWQKGKQKFEVDVIYSFDGHSPRLVVFKEEAMKAGIKMNLKLIDGTAAYKKVMQKNHQVVWWGWGTSGLVPSPWQAWHSDNAGKPQTNNITNLKDKEVDRLIDAYDKSSDLKKRQALIKKLTQRIHDLAAFVPVYQVPYYRVGYWRWWKGPTRKGTPLASPYILPNDAMDTTSGGLFWFDKKTYRETQKAMKSGKAFKPVTVIDKTYAPK